MTKKYTVAKVSTVIILLIMTVGLFAYTHTKIKPYYFEEFVRAEYTFGLSEFERDLDVKYGGKDSFKITSNSFNDAMYYREVDVIPNTPYKVSCMIKTENVVLEDESTNAGARNWYYRHCRKIKSSYRYKWVAIGWIYV